MKRILRMILRMNWVQRELNLARITWQEKRNRELTALHRDMNHRALIDYYANGFGHYVAEKAGDPSPPHEALVVRTGQ